jgi:hypothetical protein
MIALDACQHYMEAWLRDFSFQPQTLPAELAQAQAAHLSLQAFCWQNALAEVRLVRIRGKAASILNCLIFPHCPQRSPVFVAELLATGGQLRLAFVDVQTPGMLDTRPILQQTARLAQRHAAMNHPEPAPRWAMTYSSGSPLYLRPTTQRELPMTDLYSDYLRVWSEFAQPQPPCSSPELQAFKDHHLNESPVSEYLSRVFGSSWASRFLIEFLYR